MDDFIIYNPVKVHFGHQALRSLPESLKDIKGKILLVYGKQSIKKSGLYDRMMQLLKDYPIVEYGGIKSNPVVEDVNKAADLCRREGVKAIVAVGGGSVIDSAKVIAAATFYPGDAWDLMSYKAKVSRALPVYAVLTLAATGTEMNAFAVLQNHQTQEKTGWGLPPLTYPKASFLDPELTLTVPRSYTAYGLADIIAHSLEAYFGAGSSPLSDRFVAANIREVIEAGTLLLNDLQNYDLRARILLAGTMALNGTMSYGKTSADWGVHAFGHVLSLLYDMPHGASLTIAYPAWMKVMKETLNDKIAALGRAVFGVHSADETIKAFEKTFQAFGCPVRLPDWEIQADKKEEIYTQLLKNKVDGMAHHFDNQGRRAVLEQMFA